MRRIALTLALLVLPAVAGQALAAPAVDATAIASNLEALRQEMGKAEAVVGPLRDRRTTLEGDASRLAAAIDEAKRRPDGVARDRELQALLSRSKSKTDELERVQGELRWREAGLQALRRRVVVAVESALASPALADGTRAELVRLRSSIVAVLGDASRPVQIASVAGDPLDGPRQLREKADLLRDSGDKLRREARRIATRLDGVERRRHLRERSGALDEDLFGESTSSRRIARVSSTGAEGAGTQTTVGRGQSDSTDKGGGLQNGAAGAPPSGVTGEVPAQQPSGAPARTDTTVLRNLVDPATLDELRRADAVDDLERQTKLLKKLETDLEAQAAALDKQASALDSRAAELKQRK